MEKYRADRCQNGIDWMAVSRRQSFRAG